MRGPWGHECNAKLHRRSHSATLLASAYNQIEGDETGIPPLVSAEAAAPMGDGWLRAFLYKFRTLHSQPCLPSRRFSPCAAPRPALLFLSEHPAVCMPAFQAQSPDAALQSGARGAR